MTEGAPDIPELREELDRRTRDLRASRAQVHSLIERNADAIVVVDRQGVVRFLNPAAEKLFGRSAAGLVGSQFGLPLLVGETTELDILSQGEPGVAEMRVVDTEWGGEPALLAVLRDITERKHAELEREQLFREQTLRTQAEQALRERDDFIALASHELKTPAATLSVTAQLLRRQLERQGGLDVNQLRRALDRLDEQSRRLANLIEHLLDVSRINSGKMVIEPRQVDVRRLVDNVVSITQPATDQHTFRVTGTEEALAEVDPMRLEQIMTNLLDNAVKYSPQGGDVDIEIAASEDWVSVSVRDRGVGIAAEQRERLFERFYRARETSHVPGMGLGLFITRHLIDLHGGTIRVEAPEDGGSRFVVRLPTRQSRAHPLQ
jgi:signal transduction histidine kinase